MAREQDSVVEYLERVRFKGQSPTRSNTQKSTLTVTCQSLSRFTKNLLVTRVCWRQLTLPRLPSSLVMGSYLRQEGISSKFLCSVSPNPGASLGLKGVLVPLGTTSKGKVSVLVPYFAVFTTPLRNKEKHRNSPSLCSYCLC